MTPSSSRPSHRARRRRAAGTAHPAVAFGLSTVAVLLAGLMVFVIIRAMTSGNSAAPSASGPGNAAPAANPVPGQRVLALADHPLLQDPEAGLQNIVCVLPSWHNDEQTVEAFFTAAEGCLNNAWGQLLGYYHLPFSAPTLHFPTGATFPTACGTISVGVATAAYYCDNNLYVPYKGLQIDQYGDNPGVYLALFAHEYGHHVQELSGLMDAVWRQIYAVGQSSPAGLDLSRRKELQAQCFSGMFLGAVVDRGGSVTRDMYAKAWRDQDTRGDNTSGSHDHGTNAHYAQWWRTGAQYNRIAKCNTFAAQASDVS